MEIVKLQAGNYRTNTAGADRRPAATVFYRGCMSWSQLYTLPDVNLVLVITFVHKVFNRALSFRRASVFALLPDTNTEQVMQPNDASCRWALNTSARLICARIGQNKECSWVCFTLLWSLKRGNWLLMVFRTLHSKDKNIWKPEPLPAAIWHVNTVSFVVRKISVDFLYMFFFH